MSRRNHGRRGSAMILTTVVVVVVAGLAIAFMTIGFYYNVFTFRASESERAFAVAEAGLDDSINKLNGFAKFTWKGNDEDTLEQFNIPGGTPTSPSPTEPVPTPSPGSETYVFLMSGFDETRDFAAVNKIYITGYNPDGSVSTENRLSGTISGGNFTTTITPAYQGRREYTVSSIGTHGAERRAISIVITPRLPAEIGDYGLFAKNSFFMDSQKAVTDSYKSSKGGYQDQLSPDPWDPPARTQTNPDGSVSFVDDPPVQFALPNGNVGSNNSIVVNNGYVVGSALPPPEGALAPSGASIYGSTSPAENIVEVPTYSFYAPAVNDGTTLSGNAPNNPLLYQASPARFDATGNYTLNPNADGNIFLRSLSIGGQGTINVPANTHVNLYLLGDFRMGAQQKLVFGDNASLTVHQLGGNINLNSHAMVGQQSPSRFQIYTQSSGSFDITGGANVWAMVYGPNLNAKITSNADANMYGKIVANNISVIGNFNFHRDEDLLVAPKPPPRYTIKYWKEYNP